MVATNWTYEKSDSEPSVRPIHEIVGSFPTIGALRSEPDVVFDLVLPPWVSPGDLSPFWCMLYYQLDV